MFVEKHDMDVVKRTIGLNDKKSHKKLHVIEMV
jgi:hypothetical protein